MTIEPIATPKNMPSLAPHILLVEDNPDEAALTKMALKRYADGAPVEHVSDGQQALDYLFRRGHFSARAGGDPTVVLLDLKMPILDGFGVLAEVKSSAALRHTPIVVLTSSTEPSDLMRAYAAGTNAYMAKPTDFGEFLGAMKHLCAFWLQVNTPAPAALQ
jgi:CheY-like chemotaxis protein